MRMREDGLLSSSALVPAATAVSFFARVVWRSNAPKRATLRNFRIVRFTL